MIKFFVFVNICYHIKQKVKDCKFYFIQIDDITGITQKAQCSVILRYVTKNIELVKRFF